MSQLLDKIRRLSRAPSSMGFRAGQSPSDPGMLLVAYFLPGVSAQEADALVLAEGEVLPAEAVKVLWGAFLSQAKPQELTQLKEKGCDFLLLEPSTPVELLRAEGMGKWLSIELDLSPDLSRGLNSLPVEGVVLSLEEEHLSLQHLLRVHSLSGLLQKPLLARVSPQLDLDALPALAEAGVRGVVVKANPGQLKKWYETLASLTPPRLQTEVFLPPHQESL